MPTDIKNQQENKSTSKKNINKNVTSDKIPGSNDETNNINSDIIVEPQQTKKNLQVANFIYQNFITNTSLSTKTSCITIWNIATTLLELEKDYAKKHSIVDIINCTRMLMEYWQNIIKFVKCHSNLIATTKVALVPIIPNKFNPRSLVNSVVDKLTITSTCKGIRLVNNVYNDVPDIIIADSYRLEAILTQLITNAINFTEKGSVMVTTNFFPASSVLSQVDKDCGEIEATGEKDIRPLAKLAYAEKFVGDTERRTAAYSSVREDSSTGSTHKLPAEVEFCKRSILQFIVHDTGIGMSEEQQQYIYKQLNGLDSSGFTSDSTSKVTSEELESNSNSESILELGLGLSLVKQFIGNLNGKVNVASQHGKSTTFTLQVPVELHCD
ncbi:MAG: palindromic element RPE1 domain-containing protein [Rickettsia endosymbiont of Labidopullus appendiculatus]|nr:palindromic element RPE1 domain-containing protein [Rickettsia endosymbiont of Labidopullus appendiculatus]